MPNHDPEPRISLMEPSTVSEIEKPIPTLNPSIIERKTGFLDAKASARPRMMQLTTINGINIPSCWDSEKK